MKGAGRNTLIETLHQLSRRAGQCVCMAETGPLNPTEHACPRLTARETEVLDYISRGGIYKQAAEHFCCSESNIKKTMARAISHLNARSKDHAIRLWLEGLRGVQKDTFPLQDDSGRNYTNQ